MAIKVGAEMVRESASESGLHTCNCGQEVREPTERVNAHLPVLLALSLAPCSFIQQRQEPSAPLFVDQRRVSSS